MSDFEPLSDGKIYPMWQSIAAKREEFIGGTLTEHGEYGCEDASTVITDLSFGVEEDWDAPVFRVSGKDFDCAVSVAHAGVGVNGGNLNISSSFGLSFTIVKP